jgi:hypothetical protein
MFANSRTIRRAEHVARVGEMINARSENLKRREEIN